MPDYTKHLLLLAFSVAALDVITTAYGILNHLGYEANPLFNWLPAGPQQVFLIAACSVIGFWVFFIVLAINDRVKFIPVRTYNALPDLILIIIFVRSFAVWSWVIGAKILYFP